MRWISASTSGGIGCADKLLHGIRGALAVLLAVVVDAAHPGLGGEGDKMGVGVFVQVPPPQAIFLGQHHDAAALRGFVGQGGELGHVGQFLHVDARGREELHRLAVAQGDGAGLVQQQHVHVAGGLSGPAAHGQDVILHQPVDAGDADGAQQAADGGGDQADQQGGQDRDGEVHLRHKRQRASG